jgi:predicted porin
MTTGTSYVGLGSKDFGAVKVGKTFAPYAASTAVFNTPFQGTLGSYNVVMGNTGGDNRVEFGSLMEHAIWYESPAWNNLSFAALFSPGQNRSTDSSGMPQSSSNCNGGNIPGSGGTGTQQGNTNGNFCDDGGFSNAFSTSLVYDDKKAWYAVAAYELHQKANRGSDIVGSYYPNGLNGTGDPNQLAAADVGNESAFKTGLMYKFTSTGTSIGGIYEWMYRQVPSYLSYQNERQRSGFWLTAVQDLPGANQIAVGWARANAAVGDAAGQHNFDPSIPNGQSTANMYTITGTHQVDRNLSFYANYAMTVNNGNSHYDLGAGGHGITTDCHDSGTSTSGGISANGGITGTPSCWGGNRIQGISVGMRYRF